MNSALAGSPHTRGLVSSNSRGSAPLQASIQRGNLLTG